MKLTAKHKAYGGVLGVGLLALLVDKAFLGPGEAAGQVPSTHHAANQDQSSPVEAPEMLVSTPTSEYALARQLQAIAEARDIDVQRTPDAFAPPGWRIEKPSRIVTPVEARFRRAHRLNALMAAQGTSYAIVDGRRLGVGDMLDGFTLIEVTEGTAVFSSSESESVVTLKLPGWE